MWHYKNETISIKALFYTYSLHIQILYEKDHMQSLEMLWQTVHMSQKKQTSSMEKCVLSITDIPMPVFLGD